MIQSRKHLLILGTLALVVYSFFWKEMQLSVSWETLFSSPDAKSYWEMHYFFTQGKHSFGLENRPFIYPVLQWFSISFAGIYGLWLMQVGFWFGSLFLVFNTIRRHTSSIFFAYLAVLIILLNFSLINLTFHGLTEVITVFVLSLMVRFILNNQSTIWEIRTNAKLLLYLAILTTIKPIFELPFLTFLLIVCIKHGRQLITNPKQIATILLALSPFFIQLIISKSAYGKWQVSAISHITWRDYLYAQGVQEQNHISLDSARQLAYINEPIMWQEMRQNKVFYWKLFRQNYRSNMNAEPELLKYNNPNFSQQIYNFMFAYNKHSKFVHNLFLLLFMLLLFLNVRKFFKAEFIIITGLFLLLWYYILATGISYNQGDRLVIGALGLWPLLYTLILFKHIQTLKAFLSKRKSQKTV